MPTITQKAARRARQRGVKVLSRDAWGSELGHIYAARRRVKSHNLLPHNPTDTLWQHISVTVDNGNLRGDFIADMQELERIGLERFGSGISYNAGWDLKTGMMGLGMPFDAAGTHTINDKNIPGYTENQNYVSLAIVAIGMPGDRPTPRACESLSRFIAACIDVRALTFGHDYNPHSLVAAKSCPTDPIRRAMPAINARALKLAARK